MDKKLEKQVKHTPDPYINKLLDELMDMQQEEREQMAFSQRVGKTGSFRWDLRNNSSQWTKEFEALYGYPDGGYKGGSYASWSKLIHKDDRKRVAEETEEALKNADEINIEFRVVWPDKSQHDLLTRARIIRDIKGTALEVNGINIDITERKQIEKNLTYLAQASKILASSLDFNQTLKSIAELGVPEIADWCAVDMLTDQNEIKRLSVAHVDPKQVKWAWQIYKKNPPKMDDDENGVVRVLKTGISEFIPDITKEMIDAAAKTETDKILLEKISFKSVMIIPLIVESRPIGALTFVCTGDSNRHFTKAELTVAEEVASRAALAIHNSRLFGDAQHAISVRDEFISVASHELKTPVTSLKMYTQIISKQLEQRGEEHLLTPLIKMNAQIDKLTLLINDLLNISKIQLGKLEFNEESFDLQEVVEDTVQSLQSTTPTHKIKIEGTLKNPVWGDKDRISQVVTNLLTNAIKYSPKADKVKIKLFETRKNSEVRFIDYGIGIDKEQQRKIFNRFYRVTGAEERTFPGLGIGLYISSEIIKRHGGKMSVKSVKGKGSEFCFSIPRAKPKKK